MKKIARSLALSFKNYLGIFLALIMIFSLTPNPIAEASSCSTPNQVRVNKGVKQTCQRVGAKLEWVNQANKVKSVATPSPRPSPALPKEESKCSKLGTTAGSGNATLVCIKFNGGLAWVKKSRLDNPYPFEPCRTVGETAFWTNEVLVCVETPDGKLWDISDTRVNSNRYTVRSGGCFPSNVDPSRGLVNSLPISSQTNLEQLTSLGWVTFARAQVRPVAGCATNGFEYVVFNVTLPGTTVRWNWDTPRFRWTSNEAYLGADENVLVAGGKYVYKAKAAVTVSRASGTGAAPNFVFESLIGDFSRTQPFEITLNCSTCTSSRIMLRQLNVDGVFSGDWGSTADSNGRIQVSFRVPDVAVTSRLDLRVDVVALPSLTVRSTETVSISLIWP